MSGDYGMTDFITAVNGTNGLNADFIWGVITPLVPIIMTGVAVGLGVTIFRKLAKGLSKGKFRM